MSFEDDLPDAQPDPELKRALEQWPRPEPRADFRERLRAEFLAAPFETGAEAEVSAEDLGPAPVVTPQWGENFASAAIPIPAEIRPRRPWFTLGSIVLIAASLLLFFNWKTHNAWRVAPSSEFSLVRVGGRDYLPGQTRELAAALEPGSLIEVEGGALDLVLDSRLALSLAAGTSLTLVAVPRPEVLGALWLDQQSGSLAVVTGPDFPGSQLRIQTPDSEVRVVGTRFAVDVIPGMGTCVCCSEGSVSVFDAPLSEDVVPPDTVEHSATAGGRVFVFKDNRPSESSPAMAEHLAPIVSLQRIWPQTR